MGREVAEGIDPRRLSRTDADARRGGGSLDVDFGLAVRRHKLIDAIERSSVTSRSVKLA